MNQTQTRTTARVRGELATGNGKGCRQRACAVGLAGALYLLHLNRALAQDHFDYRYESYKEDDGRMGVDTQSWLFEKKITPWLSLQGEAVYDVISGATPTGRRRPPTSKSPSLRPGRITRRCR